MSQLKHKSSSSHLQSQQQQQHEVVPMMPFRDIVACMSEIGIQVFEEDLQKPSAQTTQMIFAELLDRLMACPMEALDRPRTTLLGMMQHKELYYDALTFAMFFRHCRELALLCGLGNFSQSDLIRPDAHRLRTILSGIMNFAKFRDDRAHFYYDLVDKVNKDKQHLEQLKIDIQKVEDQIREIDERHNKDAPKAREAEERNHQLNEELVRLRAQQMQLSQSNDEKRKEIAMRLDRSAEKTEELSIAQERNAELQSKILRSPERMKGNIVEMNKQYAELRKQEATVQKKIRDLVSRQKVIDDLELSLKSLIDLEKGVQQDLKRMSDVQRDINNLKNNLHMKKVELQSADARMEQLTRQIDNASEKLKRQQDMGEEMRARAKARMEDLRAEHNAKAKERGLQHKEFEIRQAEKKALEDEMHNYRDASEKQITELLGEYQRTKDEMILYMSTLDKELGLGMKA